MDSYDDNAPGVPRFSISIMDFCGIAGPIVFKAPETKDNLDLARRWIEDSEKSFRGLALSFRIAATNPAFHWQIAKMIAQHYNLNFTQMTAPAGSAQLPHPPRAAYESGRE